MHIHKQHITLLYGSCQTDKSQLLKNTHHFWTCSQRAHSSVAEVDKTSHQRATTTTTSLIKDPIKTKSRLARREKQRISFGPLAAHELWYIFLSSGTGPYLKLASPPAYKIHYYLYGLLPSSTPKMLRRVNLHRQKNSASHYVLLLPVEYIHTCGVLMMFNLTLE